MQRSCDLEQKKNGFMRNDWEENKEQRNKKDKKKEKRKKKKKIGNGKKVKQSRLRYRN